MDSIVDLPLPVRQYFDRMLLSYPMALMRDHSRLLLERFDRLRERADRKTKNLPQRREYCQKLEKEFLEIYEQITAKEKELEANKDHHTQRPFYRFRDLSEKSERIFRGLKS